MSDTLVEDVDLRGALSAAFDESAESGAGTPSPVAPQDGEGAAPATGQAQPPAPQVVAPSDRPRDESGRFVAKPAETPHTPNQPEPAKLEGPAAAVSIPPSAPPASWSAAAKAKFATLDPEVQQEVLKRERDVEQGFAQRQTQAERLNRLDAILAPRSERFRLAGLNEVQAIEALFAAQDLLERNPVEALLYLGRQSGVDWRAVFQRLSGAPQTAPQGGPAYSPDVANLQRQVQALTQTFQQREQQQQEAERQGHLSEINSFAADPKNLYFENVREAMAGFLRSGQAATLPEAYEMACWANPQVRPLMQQATAQQQQAEARAQAAQKAAQARQASGSVTGSPIPGAGSGGPAPTLREELARAFDSFA